MDEERPIDRYRGCISSLQELRKQFQSWSESSPMRHQMIQWQGPGDPPTREVWKEFLLEVGIFPFEARMPDEQAEFHFMPDASRCNSFRWRETPYIREGEYDIFWEFEGLAQHAIVGLGNMRRVHEWCLPGSECRVPKWFRPMLDLRGGMMYAWLQVLYDRASEWPTVSDTPAWMPMTRELVGKSVKAKLVESGDVWMLSAEAISRWLPPDVDDFMSTWKAVALTAQKASYVNEKPHWDDAKSTLTYKGQVVKKFKQPAKNQKPVLAAFETAGWPSRIADPLPSNYHNPKRLGDTVDQLNQYHITPNLMHFGMDGENAGVLWKPGPKPARKSAN